ncbi:MAG: hypothetical protein E7255_11875 [Lachnospiraceae bacterium]|jgi:hypothetical protein|nr:hypothetical protein [Lachnospiraceae bacterium]
MDYFIYKFERAKDYIWEKIKSNVYPEGHLFNQVDFTREDYLVLILAIIKMNLIETTIIDDYLDNKLVALDNGRCNYETYFQGLNELNFFYYLLSGCIKNDLLTRVHQINYENNSITNPAKKLEYTYCFNDMVAVGVEIKTITCDPTFKEKSISINDTLLIKKYFHDVDLINIDNIEQYKILEASSHDRQLRKNIKKIAEKFSGNNKTPLKLINVGVLVIQFATSIEEFYAYLLNEDKGIIFNQEFGNIDCLVFFSLTAKPDFDMQDIYDTGHIFSVLLNDKPFIRSYLKDLRLDNYIATKINGQVSIEPNIQKYANKEYGIFKYIIEDKKCFYVPIDCSQDEIDEYIRYLNGTGGYPVIS